MPSIHIYILHQSRKNLLWYFFHTNKAFLCRQSITFTITSFARSTFAKNTAEILNSYGTGSPWLFLWCLLQYKLNHPLRNNVHWKILVKSHLFFIILIYLYVSLRLRVQNRRKKLNFLLNFRTMHKLSDLYSGIFQNYWLFNHLDVYLVWTTSETLQNLKIWTFK